MDFSNDTLIALLIATSFAAGLNVYATVATLGLLGRASVLHLPPGLHVVESWYVIGVCAAMFAIEFFGDKVPYFDLVWNALHTFVRVPIAALLAYRATAQLSPEMQILSTIAGGLIALAAHGGKTAARVAVTPSPEPLSNIGLSLGEDAAAISLTWLATRHPFIAAALALMALTMIVALLKFVLRAMRALFGGAERALGKKIDSKLGTAGSTPD